MKRRWDSMGGGSLKWVPLQRIKRTTRIEEETTAAVIHWWNQETRVSPVHKEVVRKRVGPKLYEKHATHYLLESQVSSLLHEDENVMYIYIYCLLTLCTKYRLVFIQPKANVDSAQLSLVTYVLLVLKIFFTLRE